MVIGQKVNKQIDAYGTMPTPPHGKPPRHGSEFQLNLKPLNIRTRFDIRFVFEISRIYDSIFDSNEIPDSSNP